MVGGFLRIFFGPDSMRSCVARLSVGPYKSRYASLAFTVPII